jgi:hypothetical protein
VSDETLLPQGELPAKRGRTKKRKAASSVSAFLRFRHRRPVAAAPGPTLRAMRGKVSFKTEPSEQQCWA